MNNSLAPSCMQTGKVLHNGEYWYAIDDCLIARVIPRIPPKMDAAPDAEPVHRLNQPATVRARVRVSQSQR
jgi:hypothetical protein